MIATKQSFSISLLFDKDSKYGKLFIYFINIIILAAITIYSISTIPSLEPQTKDILNALEVTITIIFTIELILRISSNSRGFLYLITFFGVIDLLAILPFYIELAFPDLDVSYLVIVRIARMFRVLKLLDESAFERLLGAFKDIGSEIRVFGVITFIIFYFSSVCIYFLESEKQPEIFGSIPESMWWAIVTLTTVGYGDAYPITTGGKIFTGIILILALGIVAIPTGLLASALSKNKS